jgi:hypothetical protein
MMTAFAESLPRISLFIIVSQSINRFILGGILNPSALLLEIKIQVMPLGADTFKLCQMVGFKVFEVIINKMYFIILAVEPSQERSREGSKQSFENA